jgi:hypothetical protein
MTNKELLKAIQALVDDNTRLNGIVDGIRELVGVVAVSVDKPQERELPLPPTPDDVTVVAPMEQQPPVIPAQLFEKDIESVPNNESLYPPIKCKKLLDLGDGKVIGILDGDQRDKVGIRPCEFDPAQNITAVELE